MDPSQDWLLRMIWGICQRTPILHHKSQGRNSPSLNSLGNDEILPEILKGMANQGQIDKTEDLFVPLMAKKTITWWKSTEDQLEFYQFLWKCPPEELENAG